MYLIFVIRFQEIITDVGHSSAIDWWALGIFLYEMLYGRTSFRGKNRLKIFANILHKDLTFPSSIPVKIYRLLSQLKLFSGYSGESVDIVYMLRILSGYLPENIMATKYIGSKFSLPLMKTIIEDVNMNLEVIDDDERGFSSLNLQNKDPADRLGSNSGANEIKQHPFFHGINWPLIRTMSPPSLDAPFELIEKDLKAKDVKWEDDGVLVNPVDLDLF
ncbi:hypothetical protein Pint_33968 [Pistacia integerrima]|uniref:Uncharacterized protein n=1 Tax=Pistacia integerrima TaxID=434235 RepID=A0ACC0X5T6_9ROSI|nr:hypothetical protein Pint_33968 [Pistacia integerrima]